MRKLFIIFLWLSYLPLITRGQIMEDPDLQELLQPIQAKSIGYWFDNDASNLQKTDDLSGSYLPDVSSLSDGMHTIHYLLQATDGTVCSIKTDVFVKTEEALSDDIFGASISAKSIAYWFDEDAIGLQTSNDLSGAHVIDVSPLADGLHTLHYVLFGNDGTAYSIKTETFIKMEGILPDDIIGTSVAAKSFAYWFDEDISSLQTTDDLSGIYVLDVSSLSDGLHTLHYHVVGADGNIYGTTTTMFLKDEEQFAVHEPNRITKYMYWLNHDNSTVRTVTLDQPTNPYTLISLLPLQRMPIRSSNFHFQIDDGVPTIYAKNDFNIRFYDSQGEFVDNFMENERTYIDYGVSQKVEPVGELQATQTFDRIRENEIRWYTINLEKGDSVALKTDRACSIHLFSPSGKVEYHASGAELVKWDGCHASETGVYYLALHDMTAQQGTSITLDYEHIDKYAVLRQNVHVVGNGGYTTISFEGNGFNELFGIDLANAEQELIDCIEIGFVNNTNITPTFDFTDAKLGLYDACFHFIEGDVLVKNAITVEEATDIAIDTKLETPSIFAGRGNPYYNIVITCPNGGNNTAYGVPMEVSFKAPKGSIQRIEITNPEMPTLSDILYNEELNEEEWNEIKEISDLLGDTYDFIPEEWVNEETGEMMVKMKIFLALTIAPKSSTIVKLHVLASSDVETEVYCPIDWLPIYNIEKKSPNPTKPAHCDFFEKLKCVTDAVAGLSGVASIIGSVTPAAPVTGLVDCGISTVTSLYGTFTENYCGRPREAFNPISFRTVQKTASIWSPLLSCASAMVPGEKLAVEIAKLTAGGFSTFVTATNAVDQCKYAFGEKKSGVSKRLYSLDPNDIIGYTSPSGSMYISNDVHKLNYTIEFENDPEHATASAHEIVVTDQLDATKFDLSTFKPTRIEIGQKSAELTGDKNFVTTIDMRPEIYAIAQVKGSFDESTGLAKWHITSLDPMTMEPTEDPMNGVLPINEDGSGIGQILFDISLKEGLAHGTEIPNQATIIFDANEPITTPTWTNIVDAVTPTSKVDYTSMEKPDTVTLHFTGEDEGSGVWHYTVYVQDGKNAPWREAGVTDSCAFDFEYAEGIDYGFCVLATDSAGNVEHKELVREAKLHSFVDGDANSDGIVDTKDAVLVISYYLGRSDTYLNMSAADIVEDDVIDTKDAVAIINKYLTTSTNSKVNAKKIRKRIRVL